MLDQAYRNRPGVTRFDGFSLVELLVVVAVVSMLAAVLLPSLETARDKSRTVVCAARLQQWGQAFACYANENNGFWPHCDGLDRGPRHFLDPRVSSEDLADWHGWVDLLPPMIGMKPWRDHPRYGYPGPDTFYQCQFGVVLPGTGAYGYRPERDGYFSYAMNSCLELDANAWQPLGYEGPPMPSFLDTGKILWPAQVITLFDQLLDPDQGFDGNVIYREAGKYCGSYPKAFSARHGRGGKKPGGNILYADGHVECKDSVWKPDWDVRLEVPPRSDRNWYPYLDWRED
jgi:prepilin-type N-terminal cleavage/methylation domain-containing protein/prepilin-type processing-associated H-X9-DG protein